METFNEGKWKAIDKIKNSKRLKYTATESNLLLSLFLSLWLSTERKFIIVNTLRKEKEKKNSEEKYTDTIFECWQTFASACFQILYFGSADGWAEMQRNLVWSKTSGSKNNKILLKYKILNFQNFHRVLENCIYNSNEKFTLTLGIISRNFTFLRNSIQFNLSKSCISCRQ